MLVPSVITLTLPLKKSIVKYGLRTSRKRFGLSTESSEGSSASAPQKKVKPALETRSKAAGAGLEASSWASHTGRERRPARQALFQRSLISMRV